MIKDKNVEQLTRGQKYIYHNYIFLFKVNLFFGRSLSEVQVWTLLEWWYF